MVIHLMAPAKKNDNGFSAPCQKCGYKRDFIGGVIKTCLDCFLDGHSLYVYEYGFSKPADEVIKEATDFLEGNLSFGPYNLLTNNCGHFATYCKTGSKKSEQVEDAVEKVDDFMDDLFEGLIRIAAGMAAVGGAVGGVAVAGAYCLDAQRRR
ncbi:uncharacterized protein LOC111277562 [Durio zibethinus]|uniref:Uncharacterized protein LOC111277562 n=1 Tax=Durio zibethinus TaxID=66656 RepID=A0A6P5WVN1_DURZI|nr:uncharacterized protein LOC111277562 [Durio zibethinus]